MAVLGAAVLALGLLVPVALVGATSAQGRSPAAAPMAVPPATGDNAVITVKVGADRQGTTGVSGLAGTTLQLYDGTTAPTTAVADDWATCTSDEDGDCSFVVPDTAPGVFGCVLGGGANCDRRFWVVQTGVPSEFTQNSTLRTGDGDGSGSQLTPYRFRTGTTLRAGGTYSSQSAFMVGTGTTNRTASGGIWQQSRQNPAPLQQCGLSIALILDLSGSVTETQLAELKGAADTFTDALVGTPSEMALLSFSTVSPAEGATQNYPGLISVSTQSGADEFKARYASWTAGGGTNWDRGLAVAAEAEASYDVAVVITDGSPTLYSQPYEGPGNFTRLREMENGIFSANAVKAQGTRVLAVGAGAGVSDAAAAQNLAAISGPTAYDGTNTISADYYQVSDFTVVGQALRQLALGECAGSLSVVKQLVDASGDLETATLAGAGWTFGASTTSTGVTIPTTSATTDASSAVNFPISYSGGTTSGSIEVQEQTQEGTALFPVDGANAVCTDLVTEQDVPVVNVGAAGFTVDVTSADAVSCTVYNQVAAPATVTVEKQWVIDGADPVPNGNQPAGFTSELTLTGPGAAGATRQEWHVTRSGYVAGEAVTVNEQVVLQAPDIDPDLCVISTPQVVEIDGTAVDPTPVPSDGYALTLVEGANTLTIRNTVDCESRLTLAKNVEGSAAPTLWDLTAYPAPDTPAGQLPGPSGQSGSAAVTAVPVTPGVPYQLAESGGPATYLQVDQRSDLRAYPLSTGSWSCIRIDAEGNQIAGFADGLNGGVTLPVAARVQCTATNQTAQLTLAKDVVNQAGGTAAPGDFTLRATPGTTPEVEGLEEVEVAGAAQEDAVAVEVRPDHPYTLSETGPAGYQQTELECTVDGVAQAVTEITVARGQNVLCVFVNADDPASLTLRKVVDAGTTGATQTPADWTLTATPQDSEDQEPVSGDGADGVTDVEVLAGSYTLSESTLAGFDAGTWTCQDATGEAVTVTDGVVALANGADVTCSITNTAQQPTLTLVKEVVNDEGGTAAPADWTLTADGPTTGLTGATGDEAITSAPVAIGSYALTESGPAGYAAGDWACVDGQTALPVADGTVTVGLGQDVVCTITNDDQPAALTLRKVVVAGTTGATQTAADWTLTATPQDIEGQDAVAGDGADGVTDASVFAGTYALSESTVAGFTAGTWGCVDGAGEMLAVEDGAVDVPSGADVTCTITNTAQQPTLTLVKQVVNDDGGTAEATDWTLTAAGPATLTGVTGDPSITGAPVAIGSYTLTEDGPTGYTPGAWACTDGTTDVPVTDGAVTIALGQDVTCTITNDDDAALLTLRKVVDAGATGATQTPADWTLTATPQDIEGQDAVAGDGADGVTDAAVFAGTYALSESTVPGFIAGTWTCLDAGGGTVGVEDGAVTLTNGADVTCTITNTAQQPTLTLVKQVTNDDGGTAAATDWTLTATGPATLTGATGDPAVTDAPVAIGSYALTETGPAGYTPGDWTCATDEATVPVTDGAVAVALGQAVTCTVTNDDQPGTLTLVKQVVNDDGGTAAATDWTLSADGPTTGITGPTGSTAVTGAEVSAGDYVLSEADGPVGYTPSAWTCQGGTLSDATVSVANGEAVTCTIVNDDQPATLTLRKLVAAGTTGATQTPADWTLTATPQDIEGQDAVAGNGADGVTDASVFAGTYALSESTVAGFTAGAWTCFGAAGPVEVDAGVVTLASGSDVTCTITNTAVPATLTLVKQVTNDAGGSAEATDWTLTATGPTAGVTGVTGDAAITAVPVVVGTYTLTESGPAGYAAGPWTCATDEGEVPVTDGAVTVAVGQDVTCTIINDDEPATLTLVKQVVNDDGGTAEATDWTLTADGPTGVTGATGEPAVTAAPVVAGSYALSESGPAGYTALTWTCTAGGADVPVTDGTVTVAIARSVTCTVVNDDQPAALTLRKVVDAGTTGATATPADWTLTATPQDVPGQDPVSGDGAEGVTDAPVSAGSYALSESTVAGFDAGTWGCVDASGEVPVEDGAVTLGNGAEVTCTITNTAQQPTLTLVKDVTNDDGGTAGATDWTLTADGPTTGVTGATGAEAVTAAPVAIGSYALSEDGPAGYTAGAWTCTDGAAELPVTDDAVVVGLGQDVTCTVVNDDDPALLTLRKVVDSGATGAPDTPADWTVRAAPEDIEGQETVEGDGADGVTAVPVVAGTYALSESFVEGYEAGTWTCADATGADVPVDEGSLTLTNGADVTCSITNTAVPSTLTLLKQVTNDDGGTADARDWVLTADGPTTSHSGASGDDAITSTPVEYGSHALSESGGPAGYTTNDWACSHSGGELPVESGAVLLGLGQDVTCTVLNDDQPATLTLVKQVVNDHGGTAEATAWTLSADGPTTGITGASGSTAVTGVDVDAGEYALSEADGPADYTASAWSCEGGTLDGDAVTVANGEAVTCTVANTFDAPRLTLVKAVLNEEGGTATPEEWTLRAAGPETVTGATRGPTVTDVPVTPGTYTLSEVDGPEGYTQLGWDCQDADGPVAVDDDVLELAAGDAVTCTVTNTDAQATAPWTAVKTSDPPSGTLVQPGQVVTYTVTLSPLDPGGEVPEFLVSDDLTDVVDDATLIEDSIETTTGGVAVAQGGVELRWSGGPVAGPQTLTYQVRVDDDVDGQVLRNVVTAPGAEPCVVDDGAAAFAVVTFAVVAAADEECRTTSHPTPTRATPGAAAPDDDLTSTSGDDWLASTGGPGLWLAFAALWLVTGGAAMRWGARRRAAGSAGGPGGRNGT